MIDRPLSGAFFFGVVSICFYMYKLFCLRNGVMEPMPWAPRSYSSVRALYNYYTIQWPMYSYWIQQVDPSVA